MSEIYVPESIILDSMNIVAPELRDAIRKNLIRADTEHDWEGQILSITSINLYDAAKYIATKKALQP